MKAKRVWMMSVLALAGLAAPALLADLGLDAGPLDPVGGAEALVACTGNYSNERSQEHSADGTVKEGAKQSCGGIYIAT